MGPFIRARAVQTALVVFLVVSLSFALARLAPGDPFLAIEDPDVTMQDRLQMREQWGYDQPLWRQYLRWWSNLATGNFGWSHSRSQPVVEVLRDTVPRTLILTIPALAIGLLAGVALGAWQGWRRGRPLERVADGTTLMVVSTPDFVVALAMLTVFALKLRLAPTSGMVDPVLHDTMSPVGRIADIAAHFALPATTLAIIVAAMVARHQRAEVLSVMHEDFVRTAHAKGVPPRRVLTHHVLRNALGPAIVLAGLMLPAMFGGAVFVERVFGWPGMGQMLVEAVLGRDYALVQAIVLVGATLVAVGGAAAEVAAAVVNPRVRLEA